MKLQALAKLTGILATSLLLTGVSYAKDYFNSSAVEVNVVSNYGYLQQYPVRENRATYRAYIEAHEGKEYAIQVRNNSDQRIGVVIAVDGRNIISGEKSHLNSHERMYILDPYQQYTYRGWRSGKNRINRFYFTEEGGSYAAAWGDYSAMGVIAVAAFQERYYEPPVHTYDYERKNQSLDKSAAPGARAEPGTGYGNEEWSPSRKVEFEAKKKPVAQYFLKYEWRESLCKKGVLDCYPSRTERPRNRLWDDDRGYATYPPNRYSN